MKARNGAEPIAVLVQELREKPLSGFLCQHNIESTLLEFKASFAYDQAMGSCPLVQGNNSFLFNDSLVERILDTLVAFANSKGGLLLLGILEHNKMQVVDKGQVNRCKRYCQPKWKSDIPCYEKKAGCWPKVGELFVPGINRELDASGMDFDQFQRHLLQRLSLGSGRHARRHIEFRPVIYPCDGVNGTAGIAQKKKLGMSESLDVYIDEIFPVILESESSIPSIVGAIVVSPSPRPIYLKLEDPDSQTVKYILPIRKAGRTELENDWERVQIYLQKRFSRSIVQGLVQEISKFFRSEKSLSFRGDIENGLPSTSASLLVSKTLIREIEAAYSTTPLLIAADLKDINRFGQTDLSSLYFRANRVLQTIISSAVQVFDSSDSPSTLDASAVKELSACSAVPAAIREHITRLGYDFAGYLARRSPSAVGSASGVREHLTRLEAVIRWFMSTVYPRLMLDDYLVLFESENTELSPEEFNRKTIEFNHSFFDEGSTRPDESEYLDLNYRNPYLHLYAVTRHSYSIIGALEVYPLDDGFVVELVETAEFDNLLTTDCIPHNAIRSFDAPGPYKLFVDTIATHPQFRASFALVSRLLTKYFEILLRLSDGGIFITEIYAEAWTPSGEKMAKYYGMEPVRNTRNGVLYKLDLTCELHLKSRLVPEPFHQLVAITRQAVGACQGDNQ